MDQQQIADNASTAGERRPIGRALSSHCSLLLSTAAAHRCMHTHTKQQRHVFGGREELTWASWKRLFKFVFFLFELSWHRRNLFFFFLLLSFCFPSAWLARPSQEQS